MHPVAMTSSILRILAEPGIEPATFCSQVLYATDFTGLGTYFIDIHVLSTSFKSLPVVGSGPLTRHLC